MDYTDSRTARGASSTDVEKAIAFSGKGGIVSFVWHWGAPAGLYDSAEQPWWSGFYTAATDFDVAAALADDKNANYTLLMHDIDTIAVQLKKLQDAGVPVLFRPLHEAEGGWFWVCFVSWFVCVLRCAGGEVALLTRREQWGAKGPEPAKKLWGILYERLTVKHGLRNLLWVWNSVATDW